MNTKFQLLIVLLSCFCVSLQVWSEQQILRETNNATENKFGTSVTITSNYGLIGIPFKDWESGRENSGAGIIYLRSGLIWTEQAILTASDGAADDNFGTSTALTSNYALVGAPYANPGNIGDAGSAYVFMRTDTAWSQQAILTASNKATSDYFGKSVSLTDSYAVVGADHADPDSISDAGAAYVFVRSGISWTEQAILKTSNKMPMDYFGHSASLLGTYVLVGAPNYDPGSTNNAGAAFIFLRTDTTWNQHQMLTASNKADDDRFGYSVSFSSNLALIGAPYSDPSSISNAGAAYIFVRTGTTWNPQAILTAGDMAENDNFGASVSYGGSSVLVGAWAADPDLISNAGAAYIFTGSGSLWLQRTIFTANNKAIGDQFGVSVSISSSYAFVGSPLSDIGSLGDAGAVYAYTYGNSRSRSRSRSHSQSVLPTPESIEADVLAYQSSRSGGFGTSLVIMNDTAITSSPNCIDQSNCDGGRAAVLKKDINGDWMVIRLLKGVQRNDDVMFGYSLAANNYWLAVTSKTTLYYGAQVGLVSIFGKNPDTDTIERVAGLRPKGHNQPNMDFGHSIAVGHFDIIVGVPGYNLGTMTDVGAFMNFRFRISTNRWGRHPAIATAFDAVVGDRFGHSVSFDESFLAVGNNPSDDTRNAVYILTKSGFEFAHFYKISGNGKRSFGWSVLLSENELIVASPQDDDSGASTNGGCVTVFAKNSTNHFVEYDTIRHTPIAERRFGFAVARKGNRMAIGTNTCPNGAPCALQGKAYLYTKSGQQWVLRRSFSSGHVDGSDSFGTRVTIDEEDVVVGAPNSNNGSGRVYAYYVPEISG